MCFRILLLAVGVLMAVPVSIAAHAQEARPRARDLGIAPGVFSPGKGNALTDVSGVTVGHVTLIEGDSVRTGVTAIVPHGGNLFQEKVPAAVFIGNAFGKLAGSTQVEELGCVESPIVLTNTLSVGTAIEATVAWSLQQPGNENVRSVNALVGETNDGGLNDIRGQHVRPKHVLQAIESAKSGPVEEGCVGAGTGCEAFHWKGGIGTSSRVLPSTYGGYTIGVLVQANFGGVLQMDGLPVGKTLGRHAFAEDADQRMPPVRKPGDGSCMIVVATDAPLDARNLKRLAARAVFGLARTGSSYSNGSGDYAIALSTDPSLRVPYNDKSIQHPDVLPNDAVSPLFQATLEATEEAVYNALLQATTMTGRDGRTTKAIAVEPIRELVRRRDAMLRP